MGVYEPGLHAFPCEMAEFDLTSQLGQYLDKHLVFPLLEFISVQKIYNEEEMLKGKLDLLKSTNMVDFAMDVHKTLYSDQEVPKYLTEKRREVVDELKRQQEQTEKIITIFNDDEVIKMVQSSRDGRVLLSRCQRHMGFNPRMLIPYTSMPNSSMNVVTTLVQLSTCTLPVCCSHLTTRTT